MLKSAWKRTCVYIVLMHGEEESLSGQRLSKDHSWRIAEISWVLGQKPKKKKIKLPYIHPHVVREGFQENSPHSSKNKLQQIQLSDTTGTSNGTGFYCQMNWKKSFFGSKTHQMSLVQTGIKKYPMSTVKYTAGSLMLWACFSARGPEHLVQMHGIMDSIKYQQIKNQTWLPLLEIL